MNMEYQVKLPDHDFVIANGHKLTPSVIAGLQIESDKIVGALTSSGPTYIAIRSGKHDSSIAATYAADLQICMKTSQSSNLCCIEKMEPQNQSWSSWLMVDRTKILGIKK